ncbi:hypothetical protein SB2_12385 [Methylobacterium radiotolerans]|uniref:Autotransporter-associated beta strand repeat protein n=1 Tax=Methylobacterium oryzae CBMB20 TaxID=693986 RepID=A0A088B304_9HYPH|nr:Autotransporter-associated beta strand repeat protein [Methylobacterium oryzae CBMB20]KTS09403.1 hypothetical protein SB3_11940 [Methylobacterium radiotolerans]KTS47750.1 hypothetical protein SB2_12385 [Methylobacterium radiotolerans]
MRDARTRPPDEKIAIKLIIVAFNAVLTDAVADCVHLSLGYTGDVRPSATAQVFSAALQATW